MYAKIQTHNNITTARKVFIDIVKSVVARKTVLMVDGSLYKKGALITMIKKGYLDGRYVNVARNVEDLTVARIDVVLARNVPELDSRFYEKLC